MDGEGQVHDLVEPIHMLAGFPGLRRIVDLARKELDNNEMHRADEESAEGSGTTSAVASGLSPVV